MYLNHNEFRTKGVFRKISKSPQVPIAIELFFNRSPGSKSFS